MAEASPGSRLVFKVLERDYAVKQLESGSVDLVITLNWHVPQHLRQQRLFEDEFVVLCRQGHPLSGERLSLDKYLSAEHMMVSPLGISTGPVDELLSSQGLERSVRLSVPYFMQVADALLASDLILTLQRRACEELMRHYPLAILDLPIASRPVEYFLFWHRRYDKDSTNRWLRQICAEILQG